MTTSTIPATTRTTLPRNDSTLSKDPSPTTQLSQWISDLQYTSIPAPILTRAKHLLLDGIACLLVGAHLPSSTVAVSALLELEPPSSAGTSQIFGWGTTTKTNPLHAALLNSTFIQGFELDDYHSEAPLHSNSLVIPAILAAADIKATTPPSHADSRQHPATTTTTTTGRDLLLALITGYEVGPRIGLALHGTHMLTQGWHSGAVFGPSASAAAAAKLLGLDAAAVEDALGIACTQAGGLMAAQFGSDVKRMQHGFASRNGMLGAVLARRGYKGIRGVYETGYGGFLACFSKGNGKGEPGFVVGEVTRGLGRRWVPEGINVKAYAAMAGTHGTVDCVRELQGRYREELRDLRRVEGIVIELGEAMFHHGGWRAERPLTATGAQMNNAFVGATQLVDGKVLPPQFRDDMLNRDVVWDLVEKTKCVQNDELGGKFATRVTIKLRDTDDLTTNGVDGSHGQTLTVQVPGPRGITPELSNEDIVAKWRELAATVIDAERMHAIEKVVLNIEEYEDVGELTALLSGTTRNPLAGLQPQ